MKVIADLSLVNKKTIKQLNRKFRGKNQATDVLSFPLDDMEIGPDGIVRLGDIVICRSEAKEKNHRIPFLIKHAMLHLLGFHHDE